MITFAALFIYIVGCIFGSLWILPPIPMTRFWLAASITTVLLWPVSLTAWALINFARWLNGEGG